MLKLAQNTSISTEPIYKFQNNHSVDFDGVDDFIQLGQGFTYTQHTVSAWIKLSEVSRTHTILSGRDSSTDLIRFWIASSDNKVRFRLGDGSNTTVTNPTALEADRWYQVVATYDGKDLKIYVDSVLGHTLGASKNVNVTANLKIGDDDSSNRFIGNIDELAIWDRALTQAEVTEIYRIKYGANLVQNGRFDELGSELVTNGDFSTSGELTNSSWSLGFRTPDDGIRIENGVLNLVNEDNSDFDGRVNFTNGSNAALSITVGKTFVLEYEILENTNSSIFGVFDGTTYIYTTNTVGTHKLYYVAAGANVWVRNGGNNSTIKLGKLSLKQVDPNDRWTLGTGWAYGDSKIVATNASGTFCTQAGILTSGKIYKVTYTVQNLTQGRVRFRDSLVSGTTRTANGTYTELITVGGTGFALQGLTDDGGFTGEIVNIMAEEQKYVASNLKLNSGNYKSADPVIVSTKSVDLDGSEEYLEVQDNELLRGLSNLTISTWVKLSSKGAFDKIIDYSGAEGNVNRKYRLMLNTSANKFQFQIGDADDTVYSVSSTTDPDLNRWYNVICTFQGSGSNRLKIYVNGVLEASGSAADSVAEISNTADGNLRFGSNSYSVANLFHGKLDELAIFNAALDSSQVSAVYNQGVPARLENNVIGYWKMGDGTLDEAPLIADQTNATLGSDVITNGDFNGNADNWTLTNAVYQQGSGNGEVKLTKPSSGNASIFQTGLSFQAGQILRYKFKFISFTGSPFIRIDGFSGGNPLNTNTSFAPSGGDVDTYIRTDRAGTGVFLYIVGGSVGDTVVIDDVSVQIVQGNPALMINTPTIVTDAPLTKIRNYYRMGDGLLDKHQADNITFYSTRGLICDMIEPSLSTELITDGDFPAGTSAWALGTGWSLEAGACVRSGASDNTDFRQSISITANKIYQVSYTRVYVSGSTRTTNLFSDFETDGSNITLGDYRGTEETVTVVSFFMPTYTGTVPIRIFGINDWAGKITNVSVKEVNGVGGLMTNMLNTDITNDVPS